METDFYLDFTQLSCDLKSLQLNWSKCMEEELGGIIYFSLQNWVTELTQMLTVYVINITIRKEDTQA